MEAGNLYLLFLFGLDAFLGSPMSQYRAESGLNKDVPQTVLKRGPWVIIRQSFRYGWFSFSFAEASYTMWSFVLLVLSLVTPQCGIVATSGATSGAGSGAGSTTPSCSCSWIILSYSSYWPFRSNFRISCTTLLLLPALLVGSVR